MKIFISDTQIHYARIFPEYELVNSVKEADLILFTGGADVSPDLYGENIGKYTHCDPKRDAHEVKIFKEAKSLNKRCLGICRGAQFLTVMSGGSLIQHVDNHAIYGTHEIETLEGALNITSTHHQMMFPYSLPKENYTLIGWMPKDRSSYHLNGENKAHDFIAIRYPEPEIVKYHKTNCLCIQGHPEMQLNDKEFIESINNIINKYLLNEEA